MKLKPKCFAEFSHDGRGQQICLNHKGYFTPCCWFDSESKKRKGNELVRKFFDPELHIDNNENIKDIVEGEFWNNFFEMLKNNPENAPDLCYEMCGTREDETFILVTDTVETTHYEEYNDDGTLNFKIESCIRN